MTKPYLIESPRRVHSFWWTCLPALPPSNLTQSYRALRRLWHDHTMNTFRQRSDGLWLVNGRGYYTEGTEDNLTPALFETFSMLPVAEWVPQLIERAGARVAGSVTRARWSYAFEEPDADRSFRIADIVLTWEDAEGAAVLVIEAKRPGTMPGEKDLPEAAPYLRMPALRHFHRRFYCLLVGSRQRAAVQNLTAQTGSILTWDDLLDIQLTASRGIENSSELSKLVGDAIAWNYSRYGIGQSGQASTVPGSATGQVCEYKRIQRLGASPTTTQFLLGIECCAAAHRGSMPEPPFDYLRGEPTSLEVYLNGKKHGPGHQTTADRRIAHWHLDTTN